MDKVLRAIEFATKAHAGQTRKYTGEPYVMHPIAVSIIVANVIDDTEMHCAAILHDTVEDTDTTIRDISFEFGCRVATMVRELTDISKRSDGNRKVRKEIDRIHLSKASDSSKTIKLADLINNSEGIIKYGGEFTEVYMQEKDELLKVLISGDEQLHAIATLIVNEYFDKQPN